MLKRIGAEESGEFKAVASGTLPSGKPVVVNADGTVSVVSETSVTQAAGSPTVFETASSTQISATFDSNSNKVVIAYTDNGNSFQGTAIVGTVSGTSITFGTPVVFNSGSTKFQSATFDSNSNKVVIAYRDDGASDHGYAIVGTVSGTSISFGSEVLFNASTMTNALSATFDSSSNKIVIAYQDKGNADYGTAIVGTVSGTSISFGSEVVFESAHTEHISAIFDSNSNKIVIAYMDQGNSNYGTAIVGTVSGTSISFGSATVFNTAETNTPSIAYDTNAQKVVITYKDFGNSNYGTAIVGTVSGTSISFGTEVVFESSATQSAKAIYDATAQKVVIAYYDSNNSEYGTVISGTVSGTSISFDSATVFESEEVDNIGIAYDSNANKVVIPYKDKSNADYGTAIVFQPGYTSTNLTSENYIGMSRGVAFQTSISEALGSASVFNTANSESIASAYDSTNNKVVAFYKDGASPDNLEAVVGTVSDGSLSFGSSTEFHAGGGEYIAAAFDSSNGKLVVVYKKVSDNYLYSKVGTVSGTSISFGSEAAVDTTGTAGGSTVTFDSTNNKIVVAYAVGSNGYAKVGTVSGTSISYGSRATFESASVSDLGSTFDTDNGKVVITYKDQGNSNYGTAIVGTVSGTSISFGTAVVYESNNSVNNSANYVGSSKVFIGYRKGTGGGTRDGKGVVGTVSGTSISFGTSVVFESNDVLNVSSVYHSGADKVIVFYEDNGNSDYGEYVVGTISGTSVSFTSGAVFESASVDTISAVYDSNDGRAVVFYRDGGNSSYGTAIAYTPSYTKTTRGEVASSNQASVDIIGSVSDNQSGLTAGQQYYVQTDGTIGTTADSPSVLAGTAISATELLVKT